MGYDTFREVEAPELEVTPHDLPASRHQKGKIAILASLVFLGLCAFSISPLQTKSSLLLKFSTNSDLLASGLSFKTYNSYTKVNPIDSVWEYVAEPYRETIFEAEFSDLIDTDDITFLWEIDGEILAEKDNVVSYVFKETGPKSLKLTATQGQSNSEISATVVVKYVRREIRSLTDEDREKLLDAMVTVYRIGEQEGYELYGPNFRNINSFSREHLNGAGRKECDHWHDDAGIMTHHVGFTLEFEQSLQLIDPSLCLPYWEYTLDEYIYDSLENSPIFQDAWFGALNPQNGEHVLATGRFKFLPIEQVTDGFEIVNPWGLLRTPWNTDSAPFLMRNKYVNGDIPFPTPGCSEFKTAFEKTSLADMNNQLNGKTHGPVHIEIGGEWGIDESKIEFAQKYGMADNLVLVFKILWRSGYARCPDTCTDINDCSCAIVKETYEQLGMNPRDVLTQLNVLKYFDWDMIYWDDDNGVYRITGYEDNPNLEMKVFELILETLGNPGFVGEMYTSSAPSDPTFWLIHPTAERLLNWRRLVKDYKSFDETWGYCHDETNPSDDGWVCDWTGVDGLGLPTCVQGTCDGHNKDDELEFSFLNAPGRTFTNQELYDYVDPTNIDLPYMYDNYRWDHCEEEGVSFKVSGANSLGQLKSL